MSTAWVRYPPGLSRRSSTKAVAPWVVSDSTACCTSSAALLVIWRSLITPTLRVRSVVRLASSYTLHTSAVVNWSPVWASRLEGRIQVMDTLSPSSLASAFTTSVIDQADTSVPSMLMRKSPCCTPLASASEPSNTSAT